MITEEHVLQFYQLVLRREPESEGIVAAQMQLDSMRELLWQCVRSEEFLGRYRLAIRRAFHA
jgi:hypothetical protein